MGKLKPNPRPGGDIRQDRIQRQGPSATKPKKPGKGRTAPGNKITNVKIRSGAKLRPYSGPLPVGKRVTKGVGSVGRIAR